MRKIEILMSAMNQTDLSLAKKCNADTDVLIINQCDKDDYIEEIYNGHKIRMISTIERGVAKSRNMALDNANGDICIFCDDDVIYRDNLKKHINEAFDINKKADIIAFNINLIDSMGKQKKKAHLKFKRILPWKRFGTVCLAFKRKKICDSNIRFNILFGPGSNVITQGEDSVWQSDAIKKGMRIYQHPYCIADVFQDQSTWFEGYNEKFFYNAGAYVAVAMPKWKHLFKLYYLYRLRKKTNLTVREEIRWLNAGIRGIKGKKSYEEYKKEMSKCTCNC